MSCDRFRPMGARHNLELYYYNISLHPVSRGFAGKTEDEKRASVGRKFVLITQKNISRKLGLSTQSRGPPTQTS